MNWELAGALSVDSTSTTSAFEEPDPARCFSCEWSKRNKMLPARSEPEAACAMPPARKAGWLWKEGHKVKSWKRRWCILDNGVLFYFEAAEASNAKPKGTIPLRGALLRDPKTPRGRRPSLSGPVLGAVWRIETAVSSSSSVHKKYIFACAADSERVSETESCSEWKAALKAHMAFATDGTTAIMVSELAAPPQGNPWDESPAAPQPSNPWDESPAAPRPSNPWDEAPPARVHACSAAANPWPADPPATAAMPWTPASNPCDIQPTAAEAAAAGQQQQQPKPEKRRSAGLSSYASAELHSAQAARSFVQLRAHIDQLAALHEMTRATDDADSVGDSHGDSRPSLRQCKLDALRAFEEIIPHLDLAHCVECFEEVRRETVLPNGKWSFVRRERHWQQKLYTSLVGFGRTATFAAIICLLQQRLLDEFLQTLRQRWCEGGWLDAARQEADVQMAQRLKPLLEFKACRATLVSAVRGQLRVDSHLAKMKAGIEALRQQAAGVHGASSDGGHAIASASSGDSGVLAGGEAPRGSQQGSDEQLSVRLSEEETAAVRELEHNAMLLTASLKRTTDDGATRR